jgi:amino acid adenylation domain-containing protein
MDPSYNIVQALRFDGPLDPIHLAALIGETASTRGVLKVDFIGQGRETRMRLADDRRIRVPVETIDAGSASDFDDQLRALALPLVQAPINLNSWPLLRMTVVTDTNCSERNAVLCAVPHIIADVYSFYALIAEVCSLYNAPVSRSDVGVGTAPLGAASYFDLGDDVLRSAGADFDQPTVNASIECLVDRREGGIIKGTRTHAVIGDRKYVDDLARRFRVTPFVLLLAVHMVVISKVTRQRVLTVGIPLANRTKHTRGVFGFFVNTVPLTLSIEPTRQFADLCREADRQLRWLQRHQGVDVSRATGPVNNSFTIWKSAVIPTIAGCTVSEIELDICGLQNQLSCVIREDGGLYRAIYEHVAYFDGLDFGQSYRALIRQAEQNGSVVVGEMGLVDPASARQLYADVNCYQRALDPPVEELAELLERALASRPHKTAVVEGGDTLTYGELDVISRRFAGWLAAEAPESREVAVELPRGIRLVLWAIACVRAGKAYVPVPPGLPDRRRAQILGSLDSPVLVGEVTTGMAEDWAETTKGEPREAASDTPAYLIFTSGSTGEPKGVEVSRSNVVSLVRSVEAAYGRDPSRCWSQLHSQGFDASVFEMLCCILTGATLVVVSDVERSDPALLRGALMKSSVSTLTITPTLFRLLSAEELRHHDKLPLRELTLAAESLDFRILDAWAAKYPLEVVATYNGYGPTEATVYSTIHRITKEDVTAARRDVIGRPLPGLGVALLDPDGQLVPPGVVAELAVTGPSVALGYKGDPALTSQRFVTAPTGERAYKTGDLARLLPSGELEFLGRVDRQFKVRGHRVEPGEIELALASVLGGSQVVVDCRRDGEGRTKLLAYHTSSQDFSRAVVRHRLGDSLPHYMLPDVLVRVDAIPVTASGKADREALFELHRQHGAAAVSLDRKEDMPKSAADLVVGALEDLLEVRGLAEPDALADIGVTSILVPELHARIRDEVGVGIPIAEMFQIRTVGDLIETVQKANGRREL